VSVLATIAASATFGGVITAAASKGLDFLIARRTEGSKRAEASAQADATVKTRRIDDGAALRGEMWARIEKLEARSTECQKENAELKVALGETRSRLERAEQRAAAAERRCDALATELRDFRKQAVA
jgi:chromosome segregation ATPase